MGQKSWTLKQLEEAKTLDSDELFKAQYITKPFPDEGRNPIPARLKFRDTGFE